MIPESAGPVSRVERGLSVTILGLMVVLPVLAVLVRWVTGEAFAGANLWVQTLNLCIAFSGGALAAAAGRHLSLSTGNILRLDGRRRDLLAGFTSAVATAVTAMLAWASWEVVLAERASTTTLWGGVPVWVMQCAMPVGFAVMAFRLAWVGNRTWAGRGVALLAVGLACALALVPEGERGWVVWGGSGLIVVAVAGGAPLFTAMGGVAMLLFFGGELPVPISAVPAETYRIVASPTLPSLPLFTLAGYLMAEGGASKRMVRLFRAWFGWMPGGIAAAAVLVCAFFTTFTGASGVTILALGGLLLPVLVAAGYSRTFAVGLLTASGSIGLLFPPSLPVILYGVVSHVPIDQLYISGAVPGVLLVVLVVGMAVVEAVRHRVTRDVFDTGEAMAALLAARWEVALPVLIVGAFALGFMTIFETAAFTAAYAFISEVLVHRDLGLRKDVPKVFVETATLMGGVLVILGVALGFTSYLVDAEVPNLLTAWVQTHVGSRIAFILMLNVFLLIVGCLMDIYSAIMVVVPLIVPIAIVFGIHPAHLGILFLANLELGYLTPPVGLNLFLASFRFDMPLTVVYRLALPFLAILALGVLLISYVPSLTTWHFPEESAQLDANAAPALDMPTATELEDLLEDD